MSLKIVGVINVSPESFYKGSVTRNTQQLAAMAKKLTGEGADFIDVGAMSTAPYLKTEISADEEAKRLNWAVSILRKNTKTPISIDTSRFEPALAGLAAGATYLNDVTGLHADKRLAALAKKFKGVILMAHPMALPNKNLKPIIKVKKILKTAINKATKNGVQRSKIVIDPGIGFFRDEKMPWWQWDLDVLKNLSQLKALRCPILIGVSRKSFIGEILGGIPPEQRLGGSLIATLAAVERGATWIRTHDVAETKKLFF